MKKKRSENDSFFEKLVKAQGLHLGGSPSAGKTAIMFSRLNVMLAKAPTSSICIVRPQGNITITAVEGRVLKRVTQEVLK